MKKTKTGSPAPAAERSEVERSEDERSVVAGDDQGAGDRPNPEVVARAKRRIFMGEYKQRILAEADKAKAESGGIGALLRREGLYSSHLVTWRHERSAGILHALTPQKRGPKSSALRSTKRTRSCVARTSASAKICVKPRSSSMFKKTF